MNEEQLAKSERIASKIMRSLAIIGLTSTIALFAWLIVKGISLVPRMGDSTVSGLFSQFSTKSDESLRIEVNPNTITSGETVSVQFVHDGEDAPDYFVLSYSCTYGITLAANRYGTIQDFACATPFIFDSPEAQLLAISTTAQESVDTTLTVTAGALKDQAVLSIRSTAPEVVVDQEETGTDTSDTTTETVSTETPSSVETPQLSVEQQPIDSPITTPITSNPVRARTPAYLALRIRETGVVVPVSGTRTFFPISPIPEDRTAAVKFTVTNEGETVSLPWAFRAEFPTGDRTGTYRYTSPAQQALLPGMQMEFTLGFSDIEARSGTVHFEIITTDPHDLPNNNTASIHITVQ